MYFRSLLALSSLAAQFIALDLIGTTGFLMAIDSILAQETKTVPSHCVAAGRLLSTVSDFDLVGMTHITYVQTHSCRCQSHEPVSES
jgi:hypothetical protein